MGGVVVEVSIMVVVTVVGWKLDVTGVPSEAVMEVVMVVGA